MVTYFEGRGHARKLHDMVLRVATINASITRGLASCYIYGTSAMAGAVAELAAKYNELLGTHLFMPLALETMGPSNNNGLDFIKDLGRHLTSITGNQK